MLFSHPTYSSLKTALSSPELSRRWTHKWHTHKLTCVELYGLFVSVANHRLLWFVEYSIAVRLTLVRCTD